MVSTSSGFVCTGELLILRPFVPNQVFLVSSGRMTSFRPRGQLNWVLDTPAEWASMDSTGHTVGPWRGKLWAPRPAHVPAGLPITPSLLRFTPYAYHGDQEELILGVGGSAIVIVSGTVHASRALLLWLRR
jgi:hypothetical protein